MDIPDSPNDSLKITSVELSILQFDESRTAPLMVNSNDSAQLVVTIRPKSAAKGLKYYWYNGEDILDSGSFYSISTDYMESSFISENFIPNRLLLSDAEGNTLDTSFQVLVNAPPVLSAITTPADGDTLYGTVNTPFLFQWSFYDANDSVETLLEIDDVTYSAGDLDHLLQSGFYPGRHSFKIKVTDSFGDCDSIPLQDFYVLDTLGGA